MTQNLSTVLYRAVQKGEVVRHYVNDNLWYHSHPGFSCCLQDLPDYLQKDDLFITCISIIIKKTLMTMVATIMILTSVAADPYELPYEILKISDGIVTPPRYEPQDEQKQFIAEEERQADIKIRDDLSNLRNIIKTELEVTTPSRYYEMCSYYLNGNVTSAECEQLPQSLRDKWRDCINLLREIHETAEHSRTDFFYFHYLFLASQYSSIKAYYDEKMIQSLARVDLSIELPIDSARKNFLKLLKNYFDVEHQHSQNAAIAFFENDTCLDPITLTPLDDRN